MIRLAINKEKISFDGILILLLSLAVCYRGILPKIFCEGAIWIIGFYYLVRNENKIPEFFKYNWVRGLFLMCSAVFTVSLLRGGDFSSTLIFYHFLLFFPLSFVLDNKRRATKFVVISSLLISLVSLLSLLEVLGIFHAPIQLFYARGANMRAYGFMGNPNYMAYNCAVFLILLHYSKLKRYNTPLLLLNFILILLSVSRGVILGVVLYFILSNIRLNKRNIIIMLLSIAVSSYIILNPPEFLETFILRFSTLFDEGNSSGRDVIWSRGYELWGSSFSSILFGTGFNNFDNILFDYYDISNTVHNSFLRILFEFGIIGLIIILTFYLVLMLIGHQNKVSRQFIILLLSVSLMWLTNDYFLLRETFILFIVLRSFQGTQYSNTKFFA